MQNTVHGVLGLDDTIPFGKYKGIELFEIMTQDLSSVKKYVEEKYFELDNEAFEEYSKLIEDE